MKAVTLCIFGIFIYSINYAQTDTSIIGSWKLVSMKKDGIYYDLKKDSISFSKEFRNVQSSMSEAPELQQKIIAQSLKHIASNFLFEFYPDTGFKFVMDSIFFIVIGNYKDIPLQKTIELYNKKSIGLNDFDTSDRIKYKIKNGLLYLSMDNEDEEFEFVLEKESK